MTNNNQTLAVDKTKFDYALLLLTQATNVPYSMDILKIKLEEVTLLLAEAKLPNQQ